MFPNEALITEEEIRVRPSIMGLLKLSRLLPAILPPILAAVLAIIVSRSIGVLLVMGPILLPFVIAGVLIFLYFHHIELIGASGYFGKKSLLGRRKVWPRAQLDSVVARTVSVGYGRPTRYLFFLGPYGRNLMRIIPAAFPDGELARFFDVVQVSVDDDPVIWPAKRLRRELPGAVPWSWAHIYIFSIGLSVALLLAGASVATVATQLLTRMEASPTRPDCPDPSSQPPVLPSDLFLGNDTGPVITPQQASRVITALWPIKERAAASADRPALRSIESGAAGEYDDALACQVVILKMQSGIARPLQSVNVYVARQTSYPAYFLAEIGTIVHGRGPANAPDFGPPPGTPYNDYLVLVRSGRDQPWKIVHESGWTGGPGADAITIESPAPPGPQGFDARPPHPSWIDPLTVPGRLAEYWQHWATIGGPPADDPFASGAGTTIYGTELEVRRQTSLARGVVYSNEHFFADASRDGAYEFAVDNNIDLVCFTVRYTHRLTPLSGGRLFQNVQRDNYGALLPPGSYFDIAVAGLRQSCALIPPSPTAPLTAKADSGIGIVGNNGGNTWMSGTR